MNRVLIVGYALEAEEEEEEGEEDEDGGMSLWNSIWPLEVTKHSKSMMLPAAAVIFLFELEGMNIFSHCSDLAGSRSDLPVCVGRNEFIQSLL